jgi:cytochrome c peroxidase
MPPRADDAIPWAVSQGASSSTLRGLSGPFVLGVVCGFVLIAALSMWAPRDGARARGAADKLADLKARFVRPQYVPIPSSNPQTPAKIALGKRIFSDPELSATGTIACATCHDPRLSFTDGEPTSKGVSGRPLVRHTPTLWNVAWSPLLFWDGRADSLEAQIRFPIEHPDEMGSSLENAVARFSRHDSYVQAFAAAFPGAEPKISPRTIAQAVAAYERTLVSPPTRFDKWVAGDVAALSESEVRGFEIFAGKGQCINCHKGFAFTDHNFYDIGLPSDDIGRGAEIGLPAANFAFKVPTLRELVWTAPYMHDGSIGTLDDVVRIYEMGGIERPTRANDLPATIKLSDRERADLVAFLEALSSEIPPEPSREPWVHAPEPVQQSLPKDTTVVSQANKLFSPHYVRVKSGQALTILNDDNRTHNVRIYDPRLDYNSGAQEPREAITVRFPTAGTFEAFCAIHPSMRLTVEVE